MKDYLGNEIVAGMTIIIIRTKPIFGDLSEMRPKKNGKGYFKPKVIFKQPKECWQIKSEYDIESTHGILFTRYKTSWGDILSALDHIEFGFSPEDLIIIKGISDKNPKPN